MQSASIPPTTPRNRIARGDCIRMMQQLANDSVDLVVTDPPYLCRYTDRSGRTVANDDNDAWLRPAFREIHRVLRRDGFAVSFYGWSAVDRFVAAWREAGFSVAGHIVFRKRYASSTRFLRYEHEQAYLLAKGRPTPPHQPIGDVIDWPRATGNRRHPTEKPVEILRPLIEAFSAPGDVVLDPFCGSGSTLAAARDVGRDFLGIELDPAHFQTARTRLGLQS
ncbi:DNA methyltransferase [Brevundimonas sp. SORGH_AS_0993]|uniref:DNA methyltransferase n=1 Tax=Brevundimonas sp. SORGH_AS_0993 TaxID=3041794 RepID=UPI002781DD17|nr:DNA methyltransferase [Brevundimonas sp. SORGH_AS_0993]MDQ1153437.1 DNA modification methylase [Brevundimonas sp. SORGH_AS_0993]